MRVRIKRWAGMLVLGVLLGTGGCGPGDTVVPAAPGGSPDVLAPGQQYHTVTESFVQFGFQSFGPHSNQPYSPYGGVFIGTNLGQGIYYYNLVIQTAGANQWHDPQPADLRRWRAGERHGTSRSECAAATARRSGHGAERRRVAEHPALADAAGELLGLQRHGAGPQLRHRHRRRDLPRLAAAEPVAVHLRVSDPDREQLVRWHALHIREPGVRHPGVACRHASRTA